VEETVKNVKPRASSDSDEPSSKVEETVKNVKQQLVEKEKGVVAPKRSIWKRIEDEVSLLATNLNQMNLFYFLHL